MKSILLAAAACAALISGAQCAQAADATPAALAPFYQFADAMNAGDTAKAAALYAPSAPIIDEFPPHVWKGFGDWNHDFTAFFKAGDGSDFHMAVAAPSVKHLDAAQAYAVASTTLTYKIKGKAISEKGLFTFSTGKSANGWQITGWAWSTL